MSSDQKGAPHSNSQAHFDTIWRQLAKQGWCDGFGGHQYQRISSLWLSMSSPLHLITDFIKYEAGAKPGDPSWL
jgi:hypothetical protein